MCKVGILWTLCAALVLVCVVCIRDTGSFEAKQDEGLNLQLFDALTSCKSTASVLRRNEAKSLDHDVDTI